MYVCVSVSVSVSLSVCLSKSSGVVWEMKPKNRWKPFNQKNINLLEKAYQNQLSGKTEGGWVKVDANLEVRGQHTHKQSNSHQHPSRTSSDCVTSRAAGEPQQNPDDDAPAVFQPSEEELPVGHPGGVQTVAAPAQPEGPGALAAGEQRS